MCVSGLDRLHTTTRICQLPVLKKTIFSYFFVKKIPFSWRVKYVMDGSMDHSVSE